MIILSNVLRKNWNYRDHIVFRELEIEFVLKSNDKIVFEIGKRLAPNQLWWLSARSVQQKVKDSRMLLQFNLESGTWGLSALRE